MIKLHAAPLQGFTDFRFRNAFAKHFGGIDYYYSPYIKLQGKPEIKPAYRRDINPENNHVDTLIPQILTADADEFYILVKYLKEIGYKELNWNLGCPYPMVAKRGMGSGLIANAQKIDHLLESIYSKTDIQISVKIRLGYEDSREIFEVLPILEKYPLQNIAIHPRIGKQLYKGSVDLDTFAECLQNTSHKVIYNGDITSVEVFRKLQERFPTLNHWMIGRGIIANPFLAQMIKTNSDELPLQYRETFSAFHAEILDSISQYLSGDTHTIQRMYQYWTYFIQLFPDKSKMLKKIKKSKNLADYQKITKEIIH